jgi:sensor histidine kinase regulating citrate/malate metabolism
MKSAYKKVNAYEENINKQTKEHRTSIKGRFIIFSDVLFLVIFIGGSAAFASSIRKDLHNTAGYELEETMELERAKVEKILTGRHS